MFNYSNPFKRSEPTPNYEIVQCETMQLDSGAGAKHAIFLAANLNIATGLNDLMENLVERFKLHRMVSPSDTSILLVTIIGPCEASEVISLWQMYIAKDEIAAFWMTQMEKAEVGVALHAKETIQEFYSLVLS